MHKKELVLKIPIGDTIPIRNMPSRELALVDIDPKNIFKSISYLQK